jgi:uncharacterized repeat protein (TIGR01451 family)
VNLNSCKVLLALFLLAGAQQVMAQDTDVGTNAGETIASSATVDYKVSNIEQTTATATGGTLVVDRKVNLVVTNTAGDYVTATPGATTDFAGGLTGIPFTVFNGTNATMDLKLEAAAASADPRAGTVGTHTPTTFYIYLDDGTVPGALDAGDTALVADGGGNYFLDEVPEGHTTNVLVAAAIPSAATNDEILAVSLEATAHDGGAAGLGDASVETSGGDTAAMDTVFADAVGVLDSGTPPHDGKHSDSDSYKVESAEIAVTKRSWVIDDPINATTNPKAIPGATIRYCITVTNGGTTAADNVVISDPIDTARVVYNPGSLYAGEDLDCTTSTPPTTVAASKIAGEDQGAVITATNGAKGDYNFTTAGAAKKTTIFDVTIKTN